MVGTAWKGGLDAYYTKLLVGSEMVLFYTVVSIGECLRPVPPYAATGSVVSRDCAALTNFQCLLRQGFSCRHATRPPGRANGSSLLGVERGRWVIRCMILY
jgi:hypothetical protein